MRSTPDAGTARTAGFKPRRRPLRPMRYMARIGNRSAVSALLLAGSLLASSAYAADPVVISRELCNGVWLVPLQWQSNTGEVHELTALFDTGGSNLLIDPDSLERVSGRRIREGKRVRMEGVSAGDVDFRTFRPRVKEMSHLGAAVGKDFDVFLPFPAFRGKLLVLDYPAREVRIAEGELPPPDGEHVFSSRGPDERPWLTVDLAGERRRILIDSGSNGRLELKTIGRLDWLSAPSVAGLSTRMEKVVQRRAGRIRNELTIANLAFEQPIVSITRDTELMGVHVLKHFVLTFDAANRRVRFEPGGGGPVRMRPYRGSGALMRADPAGYFEVARVLADTPAAASGLRAGDRVLERDGVPVAERGCKPLDEPIRARERLGVQRGDRIERIDVEVVELIE